MESKLEGMERALKAALRLLAYRPRSEKEMHLRLQRRFGDSITEAVVGQLVQKGLLDDEAFARFWRESRERVRPRSGALIRHELLQKGVAREVAERTAGQVNDQEAALQVGRRYVHRLREVDHLTFQRKLAPHLQRRGFGGGVIRHTLRRLWQERLS